MRERVSRPDEGFSIIEVLMALTLVGITMAAMGPFFVNSFLSVAQERTRQAAVQLADSAMEQVRALKGSSLLTGRGQLKSTAQWNDAPASVQPYLSTMQLAWDPLNTNAASTLGDDAAISTATQSMTVEQMTYQRTIYVGICNVYLTGAGNCVNPDVVAPPSDSTKILKFFRTVVLVTWPYRSCPSGACTYVTSTLVARAPEPIFDFKRPAPVVKTTAVTFTRGTVTSYPLEATGGQLPNTWTTSSMPPGLSLSATGVVTGTPTTVGVYTSMITVKDKLGRTDTETVTFTVVAPPTLVLPAAPRNHVGETVSLTITGTGGTAPYTYAATGLPTGLSLDGSTGAITGTVSAVGTFPVAVTMTDAKGGAATGTYTHTVYPILTIAPLPDATITLGATFNATAIGSGGDGSYTYTASGLPVGVLINATSGAISGVPLQAGRYLPVVTVTDGLGGKATTTFVLIVDTSGSLIFTSPSFDAADQSSTAGTPVPPMTFDSNGDLLGLKPKYTATGLPPGLKFNPGKSEISGTPTTPGTYTVTVVATNVVPPQVSNYTFLWTVK